MKNSDITKDIIKEIISGLFGPEIEAEKENAKCTGPKCGCLQCAAEDHLRKLKDREELDFATHGTVQAIKRVASKGNTYLKLVEQASLQEGSDISRMADICHTLGRPAAAAAFHELYRHVTNCRAINATIDRELQEINEKYQAEYDAANPPTPPAATTSNEASPASPADAPTVY